MPFQWRNQFWQSLEEGAGVVSSCALLDEWRENLQGQLSVHTPSIAFWHLPPNSARFSYATEGALFISAQQRPPKGSGTNMTVEATERQSTHVDMRRIHPG